MIRLQGGKWHRRESMTPASVRFVTMSAVTGELLVDHADRFVITGPGCAGLRLHSRHHDEAPPSTRHSVMPEEHARDRNNQMVAELVRDGALIADSPIEGAFRTVLRHWFLPDAEPDEVYRDMAVVTHRDPGGVPVSSSSQPAIMSRMLGQLDLRRGHRVLEVGAGTGYNAALLAQLVGPKGKVVTVDVDPEICAAAERHLKVAGVRNVSVVVGDGWTQVRRSGPFDRIEATVGVWDLSTAWVRQLVEEGMLVAPLWLRTGMQASVGFKKLNGGLEAVSIEPCGFMRLRGPGAGDPGYEQLGRWTVSFDEPDAARRRLLGQLLQTEPRIEPAPALAPGWFTTIGLREPDAVSLFRLGPEIPIICCGVLDASAPALAVVASDARSGNTVHAFGGDQARRRLLGSSTPRHPLRPRFSRSRRSRLVRPSTSTEPWRR